MDGDEKDTGLDRTIDEVLAISKFWADEELFLRDWLARRRDGWPEHLRFDFAQTVRRALGRSEGKWWLEP